jgi:hypothetical protein
VYFAACTTKSPVKLEDEKSTDEFGLEFLGNFDVLKTNNPNIVQFRGTKGNVFLSTIMFMKTSEVEITLNTADGLSQERYFLMGINSKILMFANNTNIISIDIKIPPDQDVINSVEKKGVTIEGILKTILANDDVSILKGKSPYKFNSITNQ